MGKRTHLLTDYHMALSFANDIRRLFRDTDVETMKDFGLDLSSYEQVKEKAPEIYAAVEDGSMPCDEPWPKNEVALFKRWMDEGMAA
jgi:hypothetical protein